MRSEAVGAMLALLVAALILALFAVILPARCAPAPTATPTATDTPAPTATPTATDTPAPPQPTKIPAERATATPAGTNTPPAATATPGGEFSTPDATPVAVVTVQPGDTLSAYALAYCGSATAWRPTCERLGRWSPYACNRLAVGEVVAIYCVK